MRRSKKSVYCGRADPRNQPNRRQAPSSKRARRVLTRLGWFIGWPLQPNRRQAPSRRSKDAPGASFDEIFGWSSKACEGSLVGRFNQIGAKSLGFRCKWMAMKNNENGRWKTTKKGVNTKQLNWGNSHHYWTTKSKSDNNGNQQWQPHCIRTQMKIMKKWCCCSKLFWNWTIKTY